MPQNAGPTTADLAPSSDCQRLVGEALARAMDPDKLKNEQTPTGHESIPNGDAPSGQVSAIGVMWDFG